MPEGTIASIGPGPVEAIFKGDRPGAFRKKVALALVICAPSLIVPQATAKVAGTEKVAAAVGMALAERVGSTEGDPSAGGPEHAAVRTKRALSTTASFSTATRSTGCGTGCSR